LGQLQRLFPDGKGHATVLANMSVIQVFGIRDLESAKEVSEMLGQATVTTVSTQQGKSTSRGSLLGLLFSKQPAPDTVTDSSSTTSSETGRALLQPSELMRLSNRQAFVLMPGIDPVTCAVIRWFADPDFRDRNRPQEDPEPDRSDDHQVRMLRAVPPRLLTAAHEPVRRLARCPACTKQFVLASPLIGQKCPCPHCGAVLTARRRGPSR
jgi:type IV secretory pathway TraG/TraD family ATPase VirD4